MISGAPGSQVIARAVAFGQLVGVVLPAHEEPEGLDVLDAELHADERALAAGLALARRLGTRERAADWEALLQAWLAPEPRLDLALELATRRGAVRAAIDLSDGLAGDLAKLCEASGVGARLSADGWTADPELDRAAATLGVDVTTIHLSPSDDYELLLAIDPAQTTESQAIAAARGIPLAFIGEFTPRAGSVTIEDRSGVERPNDERGYDPFAPRSA
jgi:thiamine-monophosphate kinase